MFNSDTYASQALQQSWMLASNRIVDGSKDNPLAAALAMAAAARDNAGASIGLASGELSNGCVAVALSTDEGDWGATIEPKRTLSNDDYRYYVSAVMLDMLRRWLERKNVVAEYSSLQKLEELYIAP